MFATLVLTNGHIYTQDTAQPFVTAIAIGDNKILALGDDEPMRALLGSKGTWIDLNGRSVTPGLIDAHVHFQKFAMSLQHINLIGVLSLDEALSRVAQDAAKKGADDWLQGWGWSQELWPGKAFPTAADLDRVASHCPAYLDHRSFGHGAWVNSRALRLAGIDAHTPDPPGGQIQRDAQGQPTGILFEEATKLVTQKIPPVTDVQLAQAMQSAQAHCWQVGLTGIHDFDGRTCFQALQILHQNGDLGLRVVKNIPIYRLEHAIGVGLRSGFGDDWLRIGGVKIFADGSLTTRTAAMFDPYEDQPDNRGLIVTDKEDMMEYASQASAHGLSMTIHAIGDKANHDVLDVYQAVRGEEANRGESSNRLRHIIEHVQVLHPNDRQRLAQLNIIASMQPIHLVSDMEPVDQLWGERGRYSYAFRDLLDAGTTLVFGSDAPYVPIEPLPGIAAAVTRRRPDGAPGPNGWYPKQRLTMAETIYAFTMAAAITSSQEARKGSLTPGKLADLTIFDRDIFSIPPDELLEVEIAGTIIDGQFKYRTID